MTSESLTSITPVVTDAPLITVPACVPGLLYLLLLTLQQIEIFMHFSNSFTPLLAAITAYFMR